MESTMDWESILSLYLLLIRRSMSLNKKQCKVKTLTNAVVGEDAVALSFSSFQESLLKLALMSMLSSISCRKREASRSSTVQKRRKNMSKSRWKEEKTLRWKTGNLSILSTLVLIIYATIITWKELVLKIPTKKMVLSAKLQTSTESIKVLIYNLKRMIHTNFRMKDQNSDKDQEPILSRLVCLKTCYLMK